jgi:hypothetical protein
MITEKNNEEKSRIEQEKQLQRKKEEEFRMKE